MKATRCLSATGKLVRAGGLETSRPKCSNRSAADFLASRRDLPPG